MIAPRPAMKVSQRHSHVPCFGEIRMQSPWSCPTLCEFVASKIGLWKVSRSPDVSPALPVSITLSVTACSMTCNVVGCVTARFPANEIVSAVPTTTNAIAPMNNGFFIAFPPPGLRPFPREGIPSWKTLLNDASVVQRTG